MNISIVAECDICGELLESSERQVKDGTIIIAVKPCKECTVVRSRSDEE